MPGILKMNQCHNLDEVSNMQRVGSGVKANIASRHSLLQQILCAWHDVMHHPAPTQFFNKILLHSIKLRGKYKLILILDVRCEM
jgi:hypothetical protein